MYTTTFSARLPSRTQPLFGGAGGGGGGTAAERAAARDPRPSLASRYRGREEDLVRVRRAAAQWDWTASR